MINTDDAAFTAAMRAAVAERGEGYAFPDEWRDSVGQCTYVQPDGHGPACLIGAALHRLGVPLHALMEQEGEDAYAAVRASVSGVSDAAIGAARNAQTVQDDGLTWAEALDTYLRVLARLEQES